MRRGLGMVWTIVGILGLFPWSVPSVAWGQEQPQDKATEEQWLFRPGRVEVGVQLGGGFSLAEHTRESVLYGVFPRVGYIFAQQTHILPGSFEIVGEPAYILVYEHGASHVGAFSALLKYNFWTGTRWTPFIEGAPESPTRRVVSPSAAPTSIS